MITSGSPSLRAKIVVSQKGPLFHCPVSGQYENNAELLDQDPVHGDAGRTGRLFPRIDDVYRIPDSGIAKFIEPINEFDLVFDVS